MRPPAEHQTAQHQFGADGREDGDARALVGLEYTEREVRRDQDAGDQDRRQLLDDERKDATRRQRRRRRRCEGVVVHERGSVTRST